VLFFLGAHMRCTRICPLNPGVTFTQCLPLFFHQGMGSNPTYCIAFLTFHADLTKWPDVLTARSGTFRWRQLRWGPLLLCEGIDGQIDRVWWASLRHGPFNSAWASRGGPRGVLWVFIEYLSFWWSIVTCQQCIKNSVRALISLIFWIFEYPILNV
jgi:hypothetical protein